MKILLLCLMFVLGAAMGSFLTCQARRLRLRETSHRKLGRRSVCLYCQHQLKWYENIPILSWLWLRGRCRKCGRRIGLAEFLAEVLMGLGFLLSGFSVFGESGNGLDFK